MGVNPPREKPVWHWVEAAEFINVTVMVTFVMPESGGNQQEEKFAVAPLSPRQEDCVVRRTSSELPRVNHWPLLQRDTVQHAGRPTTVRTLTILKPTEHGYRFMLA
jgi:hypothetical protein